MIRNAKINLSQIDAVILDMDGVLVDTEPIHIESFRIFLKSLNIDYSEEFIESLVGYSIDHNIKSINETYLKDNPMDISAGINQRDRFYLGMIKRTPLKPMEGIPALISLCKKKGLKLALASSSVREQVSVILENLSADGSNEINFMDTFDITVSGDEVEYTKPSPDIYRRALQELDVSAEKCFTIEDSEAGIISAKSNGIYCFALKNKYFKSHQMRKADYIADSINDIVERIL